MYLKISLCAAVFIMLGVMAVGPARAQVCYMALYFDQGRTTWCATGTPPYQVDLWIYGIDQDESQKGPGIHGFAFDMAWPPNVTVVSWTFGADLLPFECLPGHCPPGITGVFDACLLGRAWIARVTIQVTTSDPGVIQILPNPLYGIVQLDRMWG